MPHGSLPAPPGPPFARTPVHTPSPRLSLRDRVPSLQRHRVAGRDVLTTRPCPRRTQFWRSHCVEPWAGGSSHPLPPPKGCQTSGGRLLCPRLMVQSRGVLHAVSLGLLQQLRRGDSRLLSRLHLSRQPVQFTGLPCQRPHLQCRGCDRRLLPHRRRNRLLSAPSESRFQAMSLR